jgi:hypothetical protein
MEIKDLEKETAPVDNSVDFQARLSISVEKYPISSVQKYPGVRRTFSAV